MVLRFTHPLYAEEDDLGSPSQECAANTNWKGGVCWTTLSRY